MTKHAKIYFKYFGYQIPEDTVCEICYLTSSRVRQCADIHHIHGRGKDKDVIDNLMGLCRECHTLCHDEKIRKVDASTIHDRFMLLTGNKFNMFI